MATPDPSHLSAFTGRWELEAAGTAVEFHTKAVWFLPVRGTFQAKEGQGAVSADGTITGTLVLDAASVNTKNKKRDTHLRTADFFDVEKFPTITYEVTSGRVTGPGALELDGTLTVHGQTGPLPVSATYAVADDVVTLSATADVDRSAWGVTLTPMGAGLKNKLVVTARYRKI
jgi:polyisoprenoid-binding protein YceI